MGAILLVAIVGGAIYIFSGGGRQKKPGYFATKDKVKENQKKTQRYLIQVYRFYYYGSDLSEIKHIIKNKGNEAKTLLEKRLLTIFCNKILYEAQEIKDDLERAEEDIYISEEERKVLSRYSDFEKFPGVEIINHLYIERDRLQKEITKIREEVDKTISKAKELKDIFGIEEIKDSEEEDDEIEEVEK